MAAENTAIPEGSCRPLSCSRSWRLSAYGVTIFREGKPEAEMERRRGERDRGFSYQGAPPFLDEELDYDDENYDGPRPVLRGYGREGFEPQPTAEEYWEMERDRGYFARGHHGGSSGWDTAYEGGQRPGHGGGFGHFGAYDIGAGEPDYRRGYGGGRRRESRPNHAGKGPRMRRTDERIKDLVHEVLTEHSGIDASEITIEVKEGDVYLTGSVTDRRMKYRAEDAVDELWGIGDIYNKLEVVRD